MENALLAAIIKALGDGDVKGLIAYLAIFFVLWIEIRGIKKAIKNMSDTFTLNFRAGEARFTEGEHRFEKIEASIKDFEHRLTVLE
jgi:hypothetical protein